MIHGGLSDHPYGRLGYPFPEHDVLVVGMRFDLLFGLNIENLQRSAGCEGSRQRYGTTQRVRDTPFNARIFWEGCIIAESALIGLRRTLFASARSIMTT